MHVRTVFVQRSRHKRTLHILALATPSATVDAKRTLGTCDEPHASEDSSPLLTDPLRDTA